ncbi:hypothetical protein RIF29_38134 [Crotalaria pallida]|uniref:Uncharacterized protein n=1 Tax=Crotalaria pallida TaxID=3830 RepID=A0AAN9E0K4_CROPI
MASPQKYPNGASLDYEDLSLLIVEDSLDKEECLVVEDSLDKNNGEANAEDDPYEVNSHPSGDKKEAESESKKKHYFHLNESPDEDDVVPMGSAGKPRADAEIHASTLLSPNPTHDPPI